MENLHHSFSFFAFFVFISCLLANFQFTEVMFANGYNTIRLQVNSNVEFWSNERFFINRTVKKVFLNRIKVRIMFY